MVNKELRQCPQCRKQFESWPSQRKTFCSQKCYGRSGTKRHAPFGLHLYIIYDPDRNYYKIGRAFSPRNRRIQLGGKRLILVTSLKKQGKYETPLLHYWKDYRIEGEWFKAEGELRKWVESGCDLSFLSA